MPIEKSDIDAAGGLAEYARQMLGRMAPFGEETPVQAEVTSEISHDSSFFALGTVRQSLDETKSR